jgi:hypothetical protein
MTDGRKTYFYISYEDRYGIQHIDLHESDHIHHLCEPLDAKSSDKLFSDMNIIGCEMNQLPLTLIDDDQYHVYGCHHDGFFAYSDHLGEFKNRDDANTFAIQQFTLFHGRGPFKDEKKSETHEVFCPTDMELKMTSDIYTISFFVCYHKGSFSCYLLDKNSVWIF